MPGAARLAAVWNAVRNLLGNPLDMPPENAENPARMGDGFRSSNQQYPLSMPFDNDFIVPSAAEATVAVKSPRRGVYTALHVQDQ
jgi:hypothetical protein